MRLDSDERNVSHKAGVVWSNTVVAVIRLAAETILTFNAAQYRLVLKAKRKKKRMRSKRQV